MTENEEEVINLLLAQVTQAQNLHKAASHVFKNDPYWSQGGQILGLMI